MMIEVKKAFHDAKKRGVNLRYITEITGENISFCKKLLTIVDELRHLDGIKGNFYLSETEYLAPASLHEKEKPSSQIIYSSTKENVEEQQYIFDTLWSKATSAEDKIKEIEEGVEVGRTDVIQNPQSIQKLFIDMVKSAKHQILLIIPTVNAFLRKQRIGIIELLKQAVMEHGVNVRILTPTNDIVENILKNIITSAK